MRRLIAWVAGAAGGLVTYRALKGKRPQPEAQTDVYTQMAAKADAEAAQVIRANLPSDAR